MTDQELLQAIGRIVETALDAKLDAKLEPMRKDIRELKDSVVSIDLRTKQLEAAVGRINTRLDRLEFGMDRLNAKVNQLEQRIGRLDVKMDKLEPRMDGLEEKVLGIRLYLENEQKKEMELILEEQKFLWNRFVPHEEFTPLEDRTQVLEATARYHSEEIQELQQRLA